jgi:hypothetical protein
MHCPVCGDNTLFIGIKSSSEPIPSTPLINYDLNGDGVIDEKDVSLMAKGLKKVSAKLRKRSKK